MQKRIIFSVILSILPLLLSVGVISYLNVNNSITRSLEHHLAMASTMAKYLDYIIESNIKRLYDISLSARIDFNDNDWEPEKTALKTAFEYSIFTDRIFLLDKYGNVLLTYPHQDDVSVNLLSVPSVSRIFTEKKPVISDIYTIDPTKKKVIFALVPLTSKDGEIIGVAGGEIDPTNYLFTDILKSIPEPRDTYIELVDSHGIIIASNDPKRALASSDHNRFIGTLIANKKTSVGRCHRCHIQEDTVAEKSRDMMAFVPLSVAPWGITIREPEEIVFAPTTSLRNSFLALSGISILTALFLGVGLSRGIVRPVHLLIRATKKIGEGNLSDPIEIHSRDEIGILAKSFDDMRVQLAESLDRIQRHADDLEQRVQERTEEIRQSREKVRKLLDQVISSQEEERKRVGRELHDDILQQLSVFLMKIDLCKMFPDKITLEKIEEIRNLVEKSVDDIHGIIKNLRPSVLDDLGLESAIKWLLDSHITGRGINYFLDIDEAIHGRRFDPLVEITLFRIVQESVMNVARHSGASNVFVSLKTDGTSITARIVDDGDGFDLNEIIGRAPEKGRGLGILGMKERAMLLDGSLDIDSTPGTGTEIEVRMPLKAVEEAGHV